MSDGSEKMYNHYTSNNQTHPNNRSHIHSLYVKDVSLGGNHYSTGSRPCYTGVAVKRQFLL